MVEKQSVLKAMNSVYYANGHGEQIFDEVSKSVKTFVLPESCYVITTTVCGKRAYEDPTSTLSDLIQPNSEAMKSLITLSKKEDKPGLNYQLSFVFGVSDKNNDIHIRFPGDEVTDIDFLPSPYHCDEEGGIMTMPPGLVDVVKLRETPDIIQDVKSKDFTCSETLLSATVYPTNVKCSGMTLDQFDDELREHKIPISELITKTGKGVYIFAICRSVPQSLKSDPGIKCAIKRQRSQSVGGKKTMRTFRNKRRTSSRKRKSTKKRQAVKR